jgi:MFS family permease
MGGILGDRYGPHRLLFLATVTMALGFALLAGGFVYVGGALAVVGRAFIAALWPAEIALRSTEDETLRRIAIGQTWRDIGAAAGPLMAGSLLETVTLDQIYWSMTVLVLVGLVLQRR